MERDLEKADAIVSRTLEVIEYLAPERWCLETPRTGILARRENMRRYPHVDVDYCQFEVRGYMKPTRFFGSPQLGCLPSVRCDQTTCTSLKPLPEGVEPYKRAHFRCWGGERTRGGP